MKSVIIIPFCYLENYRGGVNLINKGQKFHIYLKNCCVACISAARNAGEGTDVIFVTNIKVPTPYNEMLKSAGVRIYHCEFNQFNFGGEYKWALAFYKLNALYHVARELEFQNYAFLDADVYVQDSFCNIWRECENKILLYDICQGLQMNDYTTFLDEMTSFWGRSAAGVTHYGGEFFAACRENTLLFIEKCMEVYGEMRQRNFRTVRGDEFITTIAAEMLAPKVRNAGPYVYRYWTGRFHLVSTNYEYNSVVVLHVPREKNYGMLSLFRLMQKGRVPSREKVWRVLHLNRMEFRLKVWLFLKNSRLVK